MRPSTAVRAVLLPLLALPAAALPMRAQPAPPRQAPEAGGGAPEAAVAHAVRLRAPVRLDGRLDPAEWGDAAAITRFTQREPDEGQPVSERTEAWIRYDDDALYVAARLHDRGPLTAPLGRRDLLGVPTDWFGVLVDGRNDRRTANGFWVNPAGVRNDAALTEEDFDASWNAVWEAAVSTDSGGWSAEMRIPLGQLRLAGGENPTWGIQLHRFIGRRNEEAHFAFVPRSERGGVAAFGELRGLADVGTGSRLELVPYTVARSERVDPGANPFRTASEYGAAVGLDLRYRLPGGLLLEGTLNPDFGQVEADPAEVNLSAFETQLAERRAFFLEGAETFDFARDATGPGSDNRRLFYSRRIGRRPQLGAPTDAADVPATATILGAAKLTGRVGGWSVGVLGAATEEERAPWRGEDGAEGSAVVEPFTTYMAGRAVRELNGGRTRVGAALTGVRRRLDGEAEDALRRSALAGGVDVAHDFGGGAWRLSGYLAASRVTGTADAIAATQRASARFLQRPDADHLALDPDATSLAGWSGQVEISRRTGEHWRGGAFAAATSAGYEINDLGFFRRADARLLGGRLSYQENAPGPLLRSWRAEGFGYVMTNGAGEPVGNSLAVYTNWQSAGYWRLQLNAGGTFAAWSDRLTRGGPLARWPGEWRAYTELESDTRRRLTVAGGLFLRDQGETGGERMGWVRVGLRPSPRWSVSLAPQLSRQRTAAQYVAAVDDATATGTFGRRYVFADLAQTTLSLEARLNVAFTPDLSLQVYARPFVSAGDFGRYKELVAPRELGFAVFGEGAGTIAPRDGGGWTVDPDGAGPAAAFAVGQERAQRDFTLRSLQGNAVLRWDWRPGSSLFLAWQQAREARTWDDGTLRPGADAAELFGAAPDNVFTLKATWWLTR